MRSDHIPGDVLQALETLESATSPAELGPAYQTLLDWRRRRPLRVLVTNARAPALILATLGAFYIFLAIVDIPTNDFSRGVQLGLVIAVLITTIESIIHPRRSSPSSIPHRIEEAIDRWRHVVPAMRNTPL